MHCRCCNFSSYNLYKFYCFLHFMFSLYNTDFIFRWNSRFLIIFILIKHLFRFSSVYFVSFTDKFNRIFQHIKLLLNSFFMTNKISFRNSQIFSYIFSFEFISIKKLYLRMSAFVSINLCKVNRISVRFYPILTKRIFWLSKRFS